MSRLVVERLSKTFPTGVRALDGIGIEARDGEFLTIVGPSNAGKSTLLKTIAGIVRPDLGRVLIDGADVTALEPRDRHLSLLFQNIALFPSLSGYDNVAFPLRTAGMVETDIRGRVAELAEMLKVSHVLDRLPRTFSGGEQQRIAIARALAAPCRALLLDEPLTNLDARIRIALRIRFKELHRSSGRTILYVTHDQVEAFSLSDRIAVLDRGRVQQIGTPDEIYYQPINRFVASFMGTPPMNIFPAEPAGEGAEVSAVGEGFRVLLPKPVAARLPAGARHIGIGIRPEAIRLSPRRSAQTPFAAEVGPIEKLGAYKVVELLVGKVVVKAVVPPEHPVTEEGPAFFGFDAGAAHLLDLATDRFVHA